MAGFIDAAVQDIDNRLKELKAGGGAACWPRGQRSPASAPRGAGRGRPPRSRVSSTDRHVVGPAGPRGRRGGNTRSAQALELVRSKPGITIPEIATAMKIEPNYLYRVMPKLTSDGAGHARGSGLAPGRESG